MDTQLDDKALESTLAESLADLVPDEKTVSEDEFVEVVGGALEAVGGTLLFKMCVQNEGEGQHVAAASVGAEAIASSCCSPCRPAAAH